jgi:hypothetical protein
MSRSTPPLCSLASFRSCLFCFSFRLYSASASSSENSISSSAICGESSVYRRVRHSRRSSGERLSQGQGYFLCRGALLSLLSLLLQFPLVFSFRLIVREFHLFFGNFLVMEKEAREGPKGKKPAPGPSKLNQTELNYDDAGAEEGPHRQRIPSLLRQFPRHGSWRRHFPSCP